MPKILKNFIDSFNFEQIKIEQPRKTYIYMNYTAEKPQLRIAKGFKRVGDNLRRSILVYSDSRDVFKNSKK